MKEKPAVIAPASGPTITAPPAAGLDRDARRELVRQLLAADERLRSEQVARELRTLGFEVTSKTVCRDAKALGISRPVGRPAEYSPPSNDRTCATCGGPIAIRHPSWAEQRNGGVYCSNECRRTGEMVACPQCGAERWRPPSHIGRRFCSPSCWARCRMLRANPMHDPLKKFAQRMARWGVRNADLAKRAASDLEQALRRRRGGAPSKTELHTRWKRMRNGEDAELEEILAADGMSRIRAIAWLDWQRHPEDWPRAEWPASQFDPDDIEPRILSGAKERVKKALQRAGTKPKVP